jgi:hypothetical protein
MDIKPLPGVLQFIRIVSVKVFLKNQLLSLGEFKLQDFDAQIASTTICMMQYSLLSVAKRFTDYEPLGEMFRNTKAEIIKLSLVESLWQLIVDVLADLAELIEIDTETLMKNLLSDNQSFIK